MTALTDGFGRSKSKTERDRVEMAEWVWAVVTGSAGSRNQGTDWWLWGRGAAVGDMNAWRMQSGRGVLLFSVLPIPSGRPQAPGFIIAFVASQLARAPKQRAQANDDGTAFIHDGRPPRSFLLVGCPNAIPPVISVISMEPSFFKSWAIYFSCLAQSSHFGGLENDSWSPISTACNGDPSARMTLDFSPFQKPGHHPQTRFLGSGWRGDLLRPGSPLHDVDIVVIGSAWQTRYSGAPPPSCGRWTISPPVSLCLPDGIFVRAEAALLYFWRSPPNATSHAMARRPLARLGGVHLSVDADTELRGQAFRGRRGGCLDAVLSQHYSKHLGGVGKPSSGSPSNSSQSHLGKSPFPSHPAAHKHSRPLQVFVIDHYDEITLPTTSNLATIIPWAQKPRLHWQTLACHSRQHQALRAASPQTAHVQCTTRFPTREPAEAPPAQAESPRCGVFIRTMGCCRRRLTVVYLLTRAVSKHTVMGEVMTSSPLAFPSTPRLAV